MANRAYLYSLDNDDYNNPENWERVSRREIPYYDSRWNIPYAWFFLFRSSDVKMIGVLSGNSYWQETKFFTDKARAINIFAERKPLLLQMAVSPFDTEVMCEQFISRIAERSGKYLCLDPSSVFDGFIPETDEENFAHCTHILEQIEAQDTTPENIKAVIGYYSKFEYEDEMSFRINTFGLTYA